jgi:hypothetical protein
MARLASLQEAIATNLHAGDTVAMEGFTHLIPFASAHEVIRQRVGALTLVRMMPDLIYDQLIGMGLVRKLHPGVTREAVQAPCGWTLRWADDLATTPAPTAEELAVLRAIHERTRRAHGA